LAVLQLVGFCVGEIGTLTPWNFDEVVGGDNHVFVMFHAPWCGACKKFMPKFEDAAGKLRDAEPLKIMLADVTEFEYEELQQNLNVSKVPALKFFLKDSTDPYFVEPQEAWQINFRVREAMGLAVPNKCMFGESDAEDVTEATWDDLVLDKDKAVLVEFYAPWCPHCKRFTQVYNGIARKALELPNIRVVRVNVDEHKDLGEKFGVKTLPTMFAFKPPLKQPQRFELPDTMAYLEMVDKTLDFLQLPEPTRDMEEQAQALLERVQAAHASGAAELAIEELGGASELNITKVWREHIEPLQGEVHEAFAAKLKEEAASMAGEGNCGDALQVLERIGSAFGSTSVAKSEAVENLAHNCRASLHGQRESSTVSAA